MGNVKFRGAESQSQKVIFSLLDMELVPLKPLYMIESQMRYVKLLEAHALRI